ncbi:uracil-DNA glycosylase [Corynebacterium cystitidis]|uniref:uracil-DNA glycosylase n=1 Tax=Corynebacterium cystitidis TaxID=35757 RepID=UPI00358DD76D
MAKFLMINTPLPVHESWRPVLEPVAEQIHRMGDFLRAEPAYLPAGKDVLRAFHDPFDAVKVLIVGQDPYPTPGHAMGLSFSTAPGVPAPRSLVNIYAELNDDLGVAPKADGDLTAWANQGVMLLNRVLTVHPGEAASHRGKGWELVTEHAIAALAQRGQPLVAILWGRDAQTAQQFLGDTPCITSAHPSPLSARRGFFGSRPFSRANAALEQQGAAPVNWQL